MNKLEIGTKVRSLCSDEIGTVLKTKTEWNGEYTETAYLITWDLDDECDEPGWNWSQDLALAA